MSVNNELGLSSVAHLAHQASIESLLPEQPTQDAGPQCQLGDKECINRWIQAFGDCD